MSSADVAAQQRYWESIFFMADITVICDFFYRFGPELGVDHYGQYAGFCAVSVESSDSSDVSVIVINKD